MRTNLQLSKHLRLSVQMNASTFRKATFFVKTTPYVLFVCLIRTLKQRTSDCSGQKRQNQVKNLEVSDKGLSK